MVVAGQCQVVQVRSRQTDDVQVGEAHGTYLLQKCPEGVLDVGRPVILKVVEGVPRADAEADSVGPHLVGHGV